MDEQGILKIVQLQLEAYLKEYFQHLNDCWARYFKYSKVENDWVHLELRLFKKSLDDCYCGKPDIIIQDYKDLFEDTDTGKRRQKIIITGEPGSGKSTYVRKLVLDWVNQDKYLRHNFDLVFFYDVHSMAAAGSRGLEEYFPSQFRNFIEDQLNLNSAKLLIIFDRMQDVNKNDEIFTKINDIIELKTYPLVTVIYTTRYSLEVSHGNDYIWVEGFNESGVNEFLKRQKCEKGGNDNIYDLLQLPLFCAIFCYLQKAGCSTDSTIDTYDLLNLFIERIVQNYYTKRNLVYTKSLLHDQFMVLGKYSLAYLINNPTEDVIVDLKEVVDQKTFTNFDDFQLDLLIKQKIPTGINLEFKEKYQFVHEIIAEFMAAYYVGRIVNLELHSIKRIYWFGSPLLEFLFNNIMQLWEESEFSDKSIQDVILSESNVRLTWYSKSGTFRNKPLDPTNEIKNVMFSQPTFGRKLSCFRNLSKYPNLKSVAFLNCHISSNSARALVDQMNSGQFPNLGGFIAIDDAKIGQETRVFKSLANFTSLTAIDIRHSNLSLESVKALTVGIKAGNLSNLTDLDLSYNEQVGKEPELFSALKKCPNLKVLNFGGCDLTLESAKSFAETINAKNFINLKHFALSFNKKIGGNVELFSSFAQLENLISFYLYDCDLTSASIQTLTEVMNLKKWSNLAFLNVSCNERLGEDVKFLKSLVNCQKLEYLVIFGCNLQSDNELVALKMRGCKVITKEDDC